MRPPDLMLLVTACLLSGQAAAQRPVAPFLDAHVHLNDPVRQLQLMDSLGISRIVALRGRAMDNAAILAAAQASPDRLIPFVSISPEHREYRPFWERGDTTLLEFLDRELATGLYRGIGEISVVHFAGEGFPEADFALAAPIVHGIMTRARRHDLPVTLHWEVTRLRELEALLDEFPDVTVILAHGGYTPLVIAQRLMESHPKLVYELSARTWGEHPRSPDYTIFRDDTRVWPAWLRLIETHPERFVVGTDGTQRSVINDARKVDRVRLLLDQLTPGTRTLVATGNLDRLLRQGPSRRP